MKIQAMIRHIQNKILECTNPISIILLGICAYLAIPTPLSQVAPGLDNSWISAFSFLTEMGLQFGDEVIFTYGPLGFLAHLQPFVSLYIPGLVFWWLTFGIFIFTLGYIIFKILPYDKRLVRTAIFTFILFAVGMQGAEKYFTITALTLLIAYWYSKDSAQKWRYIFFSIACAYAVIMFFVKLNAGLSIAGAVGIFMLASVVTKKHEWKYLICIVGVAALLGLLALIIYFGSISSVFTYLYGCLEIVSGYNIGMSYTYAGSLIRILGGFTALISSLIVLLIIALLAIGYFKSDSKAFWMLIVVLFYSFMEFKHGFVRADGHMMITFKNIALILGLAFLTLPVATYVVSIKNRMILNSQKITKLLVIGLVSFLLIGGVGVSCCTTNSTPDNAVKYTVDSVLFPDKYTSLSYQIAVLKNPISNSNADILPQEILDIIGESSVTVMPWEINYMIYNDLETQYIPLPTLQTYQAYTPYLDGLYMEFFSSEDAPEYILVNFAAIDGGNLILETPGAWRVIYSRYEPSIQVGNILLLKKSETIITDVTDEVVVYDATFHSTDEIYLPIDEVNDGTIYLDIELTPFGKLVKTVYRIPPIYMIFTFDDGSEIKYRVVPELLSSGISTYLPTSLNELMFLVSNGNLDKNIVSLQFVKTDYNGLLEYYNYYSNGIVYYGDVHLTYTTSPS